jgi:hypothetical protein
MYRIAPFHTLRQNLYRMQGYLQGLHQYGRKISRTAVNRAAIHGEHSAGVGIHSAVSIVARPVPRNLSTVHDERTTGPDTHAATITRSDVIGYFPAVHGEGAAVNKNSPGMTRTSAGIPAYLYPVIHHKCTAIVYGYKRCGIACPSNKRYAAIQRQCYAVSDTKKRAI